MKKLLLLLAILFSTNAFAVEFKGKFLQGHFIIGIKSGYEKMNISVDESAYLLGYTKTKTFLNIHIPYLRNSLLFVIILISLEIVRELPITLILRPFNFETFATIAGLAAGKIIE